jgi:hypothetical protein
MNTQRNTEGEELFDRNSPLFSMNRNNPFGVDASYFEEFETKLKARVDDFEELKADAPFLASIPRSNPFEVPTGYFDELPEHVQVLTTVSQSHFSFKEWFLPFIKPNFIFPVAITILVAILAIHTVNQQVVQPSTGTTAETSMEEQLYPVDESTLVDLLSENAIETELASSADETITTYLIDNNVDETALNTDYNTVDHENN